jgi:hypothetical protein
MGIGLEGEFNGNFCQMRSAFHRSSGAMISTRYWHRYWLMANLLSSTIHHQSLPLLFASSLSLLSHYPYTTASPTASSARPSIGERLLSSSSIIRPSTAPSTTARKMAGKGIRIPNFVETKERPLSQHVFVAEKKSWLPLPVGPSNIVPATTTTTTPSSIVLPIAGSAAGRYGDELSANIVVVSYNVWFGDFHLYERMIKLGELIISKKPDLIALQEVFEDHSFFFCFNRSIFYSSS